MGIVFLNKNFFPLERNDLTFRTSVRRESNFSTYNSLSEELHIYIYIYTLTLSNWFPSPPPLPPRSYVFTIHRGARDQRRYSLPPHAPRKRERKEKKSKEEEEKKEKETRYRGGFSSFQKNGRES